MPIFSRQIFSSYRPAFAITIAMMAATPAFAAPAIDAAQLTAGEKAFAQCKACHSIEKGTRDGVGPNLYGVYGAKSGGHSANFKYSAAMKTADLTWNDASLNTFLLAPMKAVPGTKMTYGGVKDDTKRAALVYYLKIKSAE